MIIFLHGEDNYRLNRKLKEIIEKYKKTHKSGLNLRLFNAKNQEYKEFLSQLNTISMFLEKKLLIINNFFSKKEFQEIFIKNIEPMLKNENVIIIYEKDKIDKRTKSFKDLIKKTESQEFELLDNIKIQAWIEKEIKKMGGKIEKEAVLSLINYIGNDLWALSNELQKIINFRNKELIKKEHIQLLIKPKIETDIFRTIEAIAKQDNKTALSLIEKHLEKGDSPLYLLSMINFQFRNMLIVKDFMEHHKPYNVILKKSGLHPFVVRKSYEHCSKFSFSELKKIYQEIFEIDLDIKTGKIDPIIALERLIVKT